MTFDRQAFLNRCIVLANIEASDMAKDSADRIAPIAPDIIRDAVYPVEEAIIQAKAYQSSLSFHLDPHVRRRHHTNVHARGRGVLHINRERFSPQRAIEENKLAVEANSF
ncbi:MAG: hypothetical protein ACR2KL_12515 [Nocardioidaceae bacterium]